MSNVNHKAISAEDTDIRIITKRDKKYGDNVMHSITFPEEFRNCQNDYPILFLYDPSKEIYNSVALFGLKQNENLFLYDNNWNAEYIPLSISTKPFLVGLPKKSDDTKVIVLDMNSPRISKDEGQRIFNDDGSQTEFLNDISNRLGMLDYGYQNSIKFSRFLQENDLIEPLTVDVELETGSRRMVGFHTINEDKFKKLDSDLLLNLQEKDYLLPCFMMMASLSNLKKLVKRKNIISKNEEQLF